MKKILLIAAILGSSIIASATPVNAKVLAAFEKTFVHATDPMWTQLNEIFEVSFTHFGVPTKVQYNANGDILSAERESSVALLPMKIVRELQAKFPELKINRVTELTKKKKQYYVIRLESLGELRTVRFDASGNMKTLNKCEL